MNLKHFIPENSFRGIFVGHTKSGKSAAAASFPSPVSFEDFDGRIQGVTGAHWLQEKIAAGGIEVESYLGGKIYEQWVSRINTLSHMALTKSPGFPKTEVIDSGTAQAISFLMEAIPQTHEGTRGKRIGSMLMPGPEDFGAESNGVQGSLNILRKLPFSNLILTLHLLPIWEKQDPSNPISPSVITGEKFSLRDKLSANVGIFFDNVFRFERRFVQNAPRFFVRFNSDIATNCYGLPPGEFDITGKNFYDFLQEKIKECKPKV